jgi:hypothetical protein
MTACLLAAYYPAQKGSSLQIVEVQHVKSDKLNLLDIIDSE